VLGFAVGDLGHQTQHGNAPIRCQVSQRIERCAHTRGVRVVAVVEDDRPGCRALHVHSHRGQANVAERRCSRSQVTVHRTEACKCRRCVARHVPPADGQPDVARTPGRVDVKAGLGQVVEMHPADAYVRVGCLAEEQRSADARRTHRPHPRVISVEDRKSVRGQCLDQFRLRASDAFDATDTLAVRFSDTSDNPDRWAGNCAQFGNLTEPAHAHFQ